MVRGEWSVVRAVLTYHSPLTTHHSPLTTHKERGPVMAEIPRCPGCEAELATDAPEGLCPQCLYQGIVEGPNEAEVPAPGRTPPSGFVPPAAAELSRHFPQLEILQL